MPKKPNIIPEMDLFSCFAELSANPHCDIAMKSYRGPLRYSLMWILKPTPKFMERCELYKIASLVAECAFVNPFVNGITGHFYPSDQKCIVRKAKELQKVLDVYDVPEYPNDDNLDIIMPLNGVPPRDQHTFAVYPHVVPTISPLLNEQYITIVFIAIDPLLAIEALRILSKKYSLNMLIIQYDKDKQEGEPPNAYELYDMWGMIDFVQQNTAKTIVHKHRQIKLDNCVIKIRELDKYLQETML